MGRYVGPDSEQVKGWHSHRRSLCASSIFSIGELRKSLFDDQVVMRESVYIFSLLYAASLSFHITLYSTLKIKLILVYLTINYIFENFLFLFCFCSPSVLVIIVLCAAAVLVISFLNADVVWRRSFMKAAVLADISFLDAVALTEISFWTSSFDPVLGKAFDLDLDAALGPSASDLDVDSRALGQTVSDLDAICDEQLQIATSTQLWDQQLQCSTSTGLWDQQLYLHSH